MTNDSLLWFLNWYSSLCNGDWEHFGGIAVETIREPGWKISINIEETGLEEIPFKKIEVHRSKNNWICCDKSTYEFTGTCGPQNLIELLCVFQEWATFNQNIESYIGKPLNSEKYDTSDFYWLMKWYTQKSKNGKHQNEDIKFGNIDNPGWYLMINLEGIQNDNRLFQPTKFQPTDLDWVSCKVENGIFMGFGGPYNLPELINIFREWIER